MKFKIITISFALLLPTIVQAQSARDVLNGYADLAFAKYSDSLKTAEAMHAEIESFVESPSAASMESAKGAWLAARVPYQQTEAYRFGNPVVDDWEGKVNAWPLDEGLIDYVDTELYGEENEENGFFRANVIASPEIKVGGEMIDASNISAEFLQSLHEIDGVEANVATGYHAIEFLLWGQDLNGTEAGAGNRPHTDFDMGNCTNDNCDRRAAYLIAASSLLVSDLNDIVAAWDKGGAAREELANLSDSDGLGAILTGLGSLSYGELAGERMKLGLILHDPEEEHDCFADNTHNSHFYDALGIQNVYLGQYTTSSGETIKVPSLSTLVKNANSALDSDLKVKLDATMQAMSVMKDRADSGTEAYDQMIGFENEEGNMIVQAAIDALVDQTKSIEALVAELNLANISVEGSDSLDNPSAVFD